MIEWLPDIIELENYDNDWNTYFEAVYKVFEHDFVRTKPFFRGKQLVLKRYPEYQGKSATFWHMISEGKVEDERTPDLRRCERIGWPSPIITNSTDTEVRCWKNSRKGKTRIVLWVLQEDYVVILDERKNYLIPWTAYLLKYANTRRKMEKEYMAYKKTRDAT